MGRRKRRRRNRRRHAGSCLRRHRSGRDQRRPDHRGHHRRSRDPDRIAIASYLGQGDLFDRAIAGFSAAYADQNERDYQAFTEAVSSGRLIAQTGV
jgi:Uncharacterized protein conserved in bacteria (DUF2252)